MLIDNTGIKLRKGDLTDINDLVSLNSKWYKANLKNTDHGFLSVTYDKDFFADIVNSSDIFVFLRGANLLGYVLVNTVTETDHIKSIKQQYLNTRPNNLNQKIAFSYQILIDTELHGTGFFYTAQTAYRLLFKEKYDVLVSTVNKANLRSVHAHKKAGWEFIDTLNNYFLIQLTL